MEHPAGEPYSWGSAHLAGLPVYLWARAGGPCGSLDLWSWKQCSSRCPPPKFWLAPASKILAGSHLHLPVPGPGVDPSLPWPTSFWCQGTARQLKVPTANLAIRDSHPRQ